jgi:hypothetical protein
LSASRGPSPAPARARAFRWHWEDSLHFNARRARAATEHLQRCIARNPVSFALFLEWLQDDAAAA